MLCAVEFAAARSGVSRASAAKAVPRLRELDVIRRADERKLTTFNGRAASRYTLGDGTRRPRPGQWNPIPQWDDE